MGHTGGEMAEETNGLVEIKNGDAISTTPIMANFKYLDDKIKKEVTTLSDTLDTVKTKAETVDNIINGDATDKGGLTNKINRAKKETIEYFEDNPLVLTKSQVLTKKQISDLRNKEGNTSGYNNVIVRRKPGSKETKNIFCYGGNNKKLSGFKDGNFENPIVINNNAYNFIYRRFYEYKPTKTKNDEGRYIKNFKQSAQILEMNIPSRVSSEYTDYYSASSYTYVPIKLYLPNSITFENYSYNVDVDVKLNIPVTNVYGTYKIPKQNTVYYYKSFNFTTYIKQIETETTAENEEDKAYIQFLLSMQCVPEDIDIDINATIKGIYNL